MEVILSQDIANVGKEGDVLHVKDGYARNFLFPKKLAYSATKTNLKRIERLKAQKAEQYEKAKKEAEELAAKMSKSSCTVTVEVNDLEKLYGSVTDVDVAKALEDEGFSVDRKTLIIENSIDELGIYEVGVKLHPDVVAKVRVWVTKK